MARSLLRPVFRLVVIGAFLGGLVSIGSASAERSRNHLFDIERSKNANVVRYDLRLERPRVYDVRDPIDVYWIMRAEDGRRQELTALERRVAYGFRLASGATSRELPMRLVAVDDRTVYVRRRNGVFRAETRIAGVPSYLDRVYVKTVESRPIPRVVHVELHGRAVTDGKGTHERIVRD